MANSNTNTVTAQLVTSVGVSSRGATIRDIVNYMAIAIGVSRRHVANNPACHISETERLNSIQLSNTEKEKTLFIFP